MQRAIENDRSSNSLRSHNRGFIASSVRKAETALSLDDLIDRHIAAQLATADAVRARGQRTARGEATSVAYPNGQLDITREEAARRLAIVNYRPRSYQESRMKLIYLAAYLIATRGALNANEMNCVLEAPHDRSSVSVS